MSGNSTRQLAAFAAELRYDDLPQPVVAHAALCLLDTFGCGLFGAGLPWTRILREMTGELDAQAGPGGHGESGGSAGAAGAGRSVLWGTDERRSCAHAALVNGAAAHAFELDDLHNTSIVHLGAVVTPAALAVAEHRGGVDGRQFLAAVVAGYEVAARVGMSVGAAHLLQGWHPTGTHGALGAAAAAGSILGLDAERMVHALGTAGSQSSGLMAAQYASMTKRFHAGRAAQSGVYSALLGARGYTGIEDLFESEYGGYCRTFSPSHDPSKLTHGLGQTWETLAVGFKPYATNGSCHPTIDALRHLRDAEGLRASDVAKVDVFCSSATKQHVGWPYAPDSVTTAQMNLPYIVAAVLTDGEAFVGQFTEARIRDPALLELACRVRVHADPAVDARGDTARHATRVEVTGVDGHVLRESREHARGSAQRPLRPAEVMAKHQTLAAHGLAEQPALRLRQVVRQLDQIADITELAEALGRPQANPKDADQPHAHEGMRS